MSILIGTHLISLMAIDINKKEQSFDNQGPQRDFQNPNSSPEVREIYRFAFECKGKNMVDYQIEQSLLNKGLTQQEAAIVLNNVNRTVANRNVSDQQVSSGGGAKIPSIVYYIGILILINVLSAAFGWGFWIY